MNKKSIPEKMLFLKRFISSPSLVGSITPSSPFLAGKMVCEDEICACKSIAELGPGTGVFTERILSYKNHDSMFYAFEKDPDLADCLRNKYPSLTVFNEAAQLGELVRNGKVKSPEIIISGIPFAVLEKSLRHKILSEVFEVLPKGGKFITFQYSLNLFKELKKIYNNKVSLSFVPLNIPPAVVYKCTK